MNSKRMISAALAWLLAVTLIVLCSRQGRAQSDDLAGLNDQVAQARQQYESSLDQLMRIRASEIQQARASQTYLAAKNAVTESYRIYTQEREKAIADLTVSNPDYVKLQAQKQDVMSQLDAARQDPTTSVQTFNDLYNQKSAIKKQMEAMQKAAMDKVGAGQHWQQWQIASRNLETLQAQLEAQIESSPEVVKAKAEVDANKTALAKIDAQSATIFASSNAPITPSENTSNGTSDTSNLITNDGWGDGYYYGNVYGYGGYGRYAAGYIHGYRNGSGGVRPGFTGGRAGGGRR